jgi:hypothetical protein
MLGGKLRGEGGAGVQVLRVGGNLAQEAGVRSGAAGQIGDGGQGAGDVHRRVPRIGPGWSDEGNVSEMDTA